MPKQCPLERYNMAAGLGTGPMQINSAQPCQGALLPTYELPLTTHNTHTVGVLNNNLPSYAQLGTSGFEVASSLSSDSSTVNDVGLCAGWIAQPAATALQPMNHWSYPEYLQQHDPTTSTTTTLPLTTDTYMQPMCPSYTVVGPSSMLTYTHTPLFTNFGTLAPTSTALPQVDLQDSVLTYIPWAQPLTTIPSSGVQFASHPATLAGSQLLPMSMPVTPTMPQQDPQPQPLEQHPAGAEEPNPLEKLLEDQDQDDKYTYVNSSSIFIPGV
ncbi:POU domain class 2-associating factor 1 isoform X2 [Oncorhynchus tshawytscha]|uniref:POU domain class 2-associating factor 1 n=1 Tax=Oncorhynchus tshawytscha TaxID=74940 RepID=A0A8C8HNF8_ONCTS|nr:POU domain class 2-associating factor 1 isoform X2 [Oncorhynchus tshawytscha]XP_042153230.1 POU domain class 2-associating factor 1 isoform X2 [Oncorhynchus tshawytscha]